MLEQEIINNDQGKTSAPTPSLVKPAVSKSLTQTTNYFDTALKKPEQQMETFGTPVAKIPTSTNQAKEGALTPITTNYFDTALKKPKPEMVTFGTPKETSKKTTKDIVEDTKTAFEPVAKLETPELVENPLLFKDDEIVKAKEQATQLVDRGNLLEAQDELNKIQRIELEKELNASMMQSTQQMKQFIFDSGLSGQGIGNALVKSTLRDLNSISANQRSILNQNYLTQRLNTLTSETLAREEISLGLAGDQRSERLRKLGLEEDNYFDIYDSLTDPDAMIEYAKLMKDIYPDNTFWANVAENSDFQDIVRQSRSEEALNASQVWASRSMDILSRQDVDETTKKSLYRDSLINQFGGEGAFPVRVKTWAADVTKDDLISSGFTDEEAQDYIDLASTGYEGSEQAFIEVQRKVTERAMEASTTEGLIKNNFPEESFNSEYEKEVTDQVTKAIANGLEGFKLSLGESGSVLVDFNGQQIIDPADIPQLNTVYLDWDGNDYNEGYTQLDAEPKGSWGDYLTTKWISYLNGLSKDQQPVSREEFRSKIEEDGFEKENPDSWKDLNSKDLKEMMGQGEIPEAEKEDSIEDLNKKMDEIIIKEQFEELSEAQKLSETIENNSYDVNENQGGFIRSQWKNMEEKDLNALENSGNYDVYKDINKDTWDITRGESKTTKGRFPYDVGDVIFSNGIPYEVTSKNIGYVEKRDVWGPIDDEWRAGNVTLTPLVDGQEVVTLYNARDIGN